MLQTSSLCISKETYGCDKRWRVVRGEISFNDVELKIRIEYVIHCSRTVGEL